jgi:hypothetical protein
MLLLILSWLFLFSMRSFPPCLFPDAVEVELVEGLAFLASHGHLAWLCRVLELAVVAFGVAVLPTVSQEHPDHFNHFVPFHISYRLTLQR